MQAIDDNSLEQMTSLENELSNLKHEVDELMERKQRLEGDLPSLIDQLLAAYHARWPMLNVVEDHE